MRAASEAFAAKGFTGARTQAIADAAGVNKALISYYFGGKQELYSAVVLDHIERAQGVLAAAIPADAPASERLDAFLRAFGRQFEKQPDFGPIIIREQMDGSRHLEAEVRERFFGFFAMVREILERGITSGEFRSLDPHATHLSLVGSLVMYQLTAPARETYAREVADLPFMPDWLDYVEHVREVFQRGLRADHAGERRSETQSSQTKRKNP